MNVTAQSYKCPPDDATDLPATVFRLLKTAELLAEYFLSYEEEGKKEPASPEQQCKWTGISVFTSIEEARHHISLFRTKPFIAQGLLTDQDGKGKKTPSPRIPSHLTWWPAAGMDRTSSFDCL